MFSTISTFVSFITLHLIDVLLDIRIKVEMIAISYIKAQRPSWFEFTNRTSEGMSKKCTGPGD